MEETAGAVFPEGRCPPGEKIKIVAGTCREFLLLAEIANSVGGAYVGWGLAQIRQKSEETQTGLMKLLRSCRDRTEVWSPAVVDLRAGASRCSDRAGQPASSRLQESFLC